MRLLQTHQTEGLRRACLVVDQLDEIMSGCRHRGERSNLEAYVWKFSTATHSAMLPEDVETNEGDGD